jgi:pilus assembly protein FimV
MKQWKQISAVAAAVMALTSGSVHALSLGAPSSQAILGETLRMSIPLELESGEDTEDGCPQVEVLYGESRVDPGRVILGVSPQSGRHRVITVRAIEPINEPLIDVTLSYGCGARLSRKFTVFANPPEFVPTVVLSPASTTLSTARMEGDASMGMSSGSGVMREETEAPAPRAIRPVPVRRPAGASAPRSKHPPKPSKPVPVAEVKQVTPVEQVTAPVPAPVPKPSVPASVPEVASQAAPAAPAPKASSVVQRKPAPPKVEAGPRLVLDPVTPMMASLPGAGVSGAASGVQPNLVNSQAGSDMGQLQAQLAEDRRRLDDMEKLITQLRLDAAQAAASGPGLERPIGLSDARHPVWLLAVSGVAALSLLFSGYLLLRLRRQEQARSWWTPPDR